MPRSIDHPLPPPPVPDAAVGSISLDTRFTREYGVRLPFAGAGMAFVSMPALVAAVSNAGGVGVLGNAIEPPDNTRTLIARVRSLTSAPFGVDFLHDDSAFGPLVTDAHVDVCAEERVPIVVFHMNVPTQAWVDRLHVAGVRVWMQAASVKQAHEALDLGVDALIAQGAEAGGHNRSTTPLLTLLPQVLAAARDLPDVPVLAAGGIADGEAVFRALIAGADAVWVGTRLVATTEARAHHEYQRRLTEAQAGDTTTTTLFGPEYPNRPYRVLRNRVVREHEDGTAPPPSSEPIGKTVLFPLTTPRPYAMPELSAIVPTPETVGDFDAMGLAAGAGVGAIDAVLPAGAVIQSMMADARQRLHRGATA